MHVAAALPRTLPSIRSFPNGNWSHCPLLLSKFHAAEPKCSTNHVTASASIGIVISCVAS
jgi:hypothetical protein